MRLADLFEHHTASSNNVVGAGDKTGGVPAVNPGSYELNLIIGAHEGRYFRFQKHLGTNPISRLRHSVRTLLSRVR